MRDIRQTSEYAAYLSKIGWRVERIDGINYFIKKLPLIGSLIKIQRPEQLDIQTARQLDKKYRAFQIIVEPKNSARQLDILTNSGFKQTKNPFLPSKTLHLDLTKSKGQLFANLKKDCRSALKKTMHYELCTMHCDEFRRLWKGAVG